MLQEHKEEYERLFRDVPGGNLIYAASILSDMQESHSEDQELVNHLNDAKELIIEAAKQMKKEFGLMKAKGGGK